LAVFDNRTGLLLSGDLLYPGLLTVRDWPAFRASARRLQDFAAHHAIRWVLGHHIEMTRTPGLAYPLGCTFQPDEHPLPLLPSDIEALHEACEAMAQAPCDAFRDSFRIVLKPEAARNLPGASE
jgi:glyoxylase-like metal-dependent hydrolase (beta-lactamase superfamily II)